MIKFKSKGQYCPTVNLMKFSNKYVLIISIIFCALLNSSLANGQEPIPFLTGKWLGTVLYQATTTGFSSSKDSTSLNILEQSFLKFKGNAESISNEKRHYGFLKGI